MVGSSGSVKFCPKLPDTSKATKMMVAVRRFVIFSLKEKKLQNDVTTIDDVTTFDDATTINDVT